MSNKSKTPIILFLSFIAVWVLVMIFLVSQTYFAEKVNFQPGKYYALKDENPFRERVMIKILERKGEWIKFSFVYTDEGKIVLGDPTSDKIDINDEIFMEASKEWINEYALRSNKLRLE